MVDGHSGLSGRALIDRRRHTVRQARLSGLDEFGPDVSVLLLAGSTPTIRMLLRPTGPGQLRFELYLEQARGGRGGYHEEIFKKR